MSFKMAACIVNGMDCYEEPITINYCKEASDYGGQYSWIAQELKPHVITGSVQQ